MIVRKTNVSRYDSLKIGQKNVTTWGLCDILSTWGLYANMLSRRSRPESEPVLTYVKCKKLLLKVKWINAT